MTTATKNEWLPPLIFNVFKPAGVGSFDVVRHFKRSLPRNSFGKIGHFGTLDPFACGVLMIGIGGAARLNDLVHEESPKTYLAVGKLGIEKDTGDHEGKTLQTDESAYLRGTIAQFDRPFIEALVKEKFLGEYWQAPHQFSAAKYEGRTLHAWARDGVTIKKEKVRRFVHHVEVVRWQFPYLSVRVTVSSGTYVRTLFAEMAQALGTLGHLIALQRESVGKIHYEQSLLRKDWVKPGDSFESIRARSLKPEEVLPYERVILREDQMKSFMNGVPLKCDGPVEANKRVWMLDATGELLGLAKSQDDKWTTEINFAAAQASLQADRSR